jgi:hypothetical protein
LNSSPCITKEIISRRIRWVGHVALKGKVKNSYKILLVKPDGKGDVEIDAR